MATADQIIAALSKDPRLMWDVLRASRILGPWEDAFGGGLERWDPWRRTRARVVSADRKDGQGVCWAVRWLDAKDEYQEEEIHDKAVDTVCANANAVLQRAGFVLVEGRFEDYFRVKVYCHPGSTSETKT